MAKRLDPSVLLATSMHAQPGVYAVLLGSGVSRAAGIPTGWGIVEELVRRLAVQQDGVGSSFPKANSFDASKWWSERFDGLLGYSSLLGELAPTGPARQGLLAPFFERAEGEDNDIKRPTRAHRAVAQLVKRGSVRVVITTNFDRLMEQALTEVGMEPQVIARPEAAAGMRPLAHAPATVIKLHGDYQDVESLNTDDELSHYPTQWTTLLNQIFDEYGLLVAGWSADWDRALVQSLQAAPSRRYPLYWDSRSSRGANATRLLTARQGTVIPATDADSLFGRLVEHLDALDSLTEPQLTTELEVSRLKKFLPDPTRRIDLFDLVADQVREVEHETDRVGRLTNLNISEFDEAITALARRSQPLIRLLAEAVLHDDGTHDKLWLRTLQSLLHLRTVPNQSFDDAAKSLQHLPAQLALFAMAAVAVTEGRDPLLRQLATQPTWQPPFMQVDPQPAHYVLHLDRVLEVDAAKKLPRWSGTSWRYPQSELIRALLIPTLQAVIPADIVSERIDDAEYRLAIFQWVRAESKLGRFPQNGRYLGERAWANTGEPNAELRLRRAATQPDIAAAYTWPDAPNIDETHLSLRAEIGKRDRF